MNATDSTCIVCAGKSKAILNWDFAEMKREYAKTFGRDLPDEAIPAEYVMLKCTQCGLVYARPAVPGNDCFYAWITAEQNYYQAFRWEWGVVADLVARKNGPKLELLEIGCGTGDFLAFISPKVDADIVGIDTHAPSVEACLKRDLNAKHLDLDQFIRRNPESKYDAICAFHCLEHVADPRSLIESMAKVLAPGGWIFVSVPYSPTSRDAVGVDCMNLPPHHLTQWNEKSLARLGKVTGFNVDVLTDDGIFVESTARTVYWHFISNFTAGSPASTIRNLLRMVSHPALLLKCVLFAATRETVAGKRAGDTALAIFRP